MNLAVFAAASSAPLPAPQAEREARMRATNAVRHEREAKGVFPGVNGATCPARPGRRTQPGSASTPCGNLGAAKDRRCEPSSRDRRLTTKIA